MPFHVRDPETDALVRELARRRKIGLTEAIRLAVKEELRRGEDELSLWERLQPIVRSLDKYEDTGVVTDKAFFDDLSGN